MLRPYLSEGVVEITSRLTDITVKELPDGLVLLDELTGVVYANPRASEFFHWTSDELLGLRSAELLDRLSAHAVGNAPRAQLQDALAARVPERIVEVEIAPGGNGNGATEQRRIVAFRFFPLRDSPDDLGTGILLRDVTQERTADAMKTQLLSTVSHELRTPLASIKGFATTLLRQDVKWDDATQRDFLKIIEEESDRLTEIIDNLLDMSQIEAGALRIAREPTQIRQMIREVVDEMRMRTEAHYFVVDLPSEMPRLLMDGRRVRQVLTNLIGNAIKYTQRGQITVSCEVEGAHVVVSVADQGQGIPAEYQDKVFDRFFQVDGASTRRVGGSGLGLSISRGIIQAHEGKLWVESEPGQGSIFRFTLPIANDEAVE